MTMRSVKPGLCWVRLILMHFILVSVLLLNTQTVKALEKLSLVVENINSNNWQLEGVSLSLSALSDKTPQLALSIKQLSLPEPFSDILLFDIQCLSFDWQHNKIECKKGKASIKSGLIQPSPFNLSFLISEKQSQFSLQNLKIAKGTLSLSAKEAAKKWHVIVKSKKIHLPSIKSYLNKQTTGIDEISKGKMDADIELQGNNKGLKKLLLKTLYKDLSLQVNKGQIITESLNFEFELNAKLDKDISYWEIKHQINQGELFVDPLYLEIDQTLTLSAKGIKNKQGDVSIQQVKFNHPGVMKLMANGLIKQQPALSIDTAHISINITDLEKFAIPYVTPFIEQTELEGIKLKGQFESEIEINKSAIKQFSARILNFSVYDKKKRFALNDAKGKINWSVNPDFLTPSEFSWQQIKVRAIPIDAGIIKFMGRNKSFELLEPSAIGLLGGILNIKQFSWHKKSDSEPRVFFEGDVNHVSLEQLTQALNWTPLSGNISGSIPGVKYENKTLTLKGGLKVKVFDGTIKINKLSSSGLFSNFSRFNMDMEIDNLDLHAITQKIEMGAMQGRISGFVNNLYLENWKPVTFYAWIGTPENDDSRHRISQKAVENIASIGGGGAANLISKSFLRFFDSFGYDRLGFGCYLHQGVCQLMGVEAADQGYYIIKGGGLPRINVIGYNPKIDFKVLLKRLSRISASDKVEIK